MQFNIAIEGNFWLCLSLWLIQDSNWKGRVLWKLFGGLATILQNWISCNEQKMREAHITRRGTSFYLLIFIEKIINRKIEHSLFIRLCHRIWLLHLHSMVKREAFSLIFPLMDSMAGGFYRLFPWNFWEIRRQPFPMAQSLVIAVS